MLDNVSRFKEKNFLSGSFRISSKLELQAKQRKHWWKKSKCNAKR